MSNPLKDYKDAVRAALPSGITFASDVARYFYNAVPRSRETRYSEIKRYRDYILKTSGVESAYRDLLTSLNAAGTPAVSYEILPDGRLFQDTAGTTPATSAGDPVALMLDSGQWDGASVSQVISDAGGDPTSVPGNHATQPTTTKQPILRQTAGGKWYLERDAVDDYMVFNKGLSGKRWTACMAYVPDGEDWLLISREGDNSPWAGVGQMGSTNTDLTPTNTSQLDIWFGNVVSSATTRGGQYTLSQSANTVFVEFDVSALWSNIVIGQYNAGGFTSPGNIYGFTLFEGALTADQRAIVQAYYESIVP